MRQFRVSIGRMMLWVFGLAIALAALRHASDVLGGIVYLLTMGVLVASVLGVVYRREAGRAFWLGFALMGWAYVFVSSNSVWDEGNARFGASGFGTQRWDLITTRVLDSIEPFIQANPTSWEPRFIRWISRSDPRSNAILKKMEEPLSMPFGNETPFKDVLKYIQTATICDELPHGIPIFVDPVALSDTDHKMKDPVQIELENVPLHRSLKLILNQMMMTYSVDDGLVSIHSEDFYGTSDQWVRPFRRVGHCYFAVVAGLIGGLIGRRFHATRDRVGGPDFHAARSNPTAGP